MHTQPVVRQGSNWRPTASSPMTLPTGLRHPRRPGCLRSQLRRGGGGGGGGRPGGESGRRRPEISPRSASPTLTAEIPRRLSDMALRLRHCRGGGGPGVSWWLLRVVAAVAAAGLNPLCARFRCWLLGPERWRAPLSLCVAADTALGVAAVRHACLQCASDGVRDWHGLPA